ncbi:MAG: VWA domain-containing protein [Acidobacteria bacterium]|nr:VWA domain-containing protein [Acidobacteriota bacterium]
MTKNEGPPVHISVLLDRSGSMSAIAADVVGGFNSFLEEQRQHPGAARLTLVQFDTVDPFEVVVDGEDLDGVSDLEQGAYIPRGGTPLLDAVGALIASIDAEIAARADRGLPIEDQLVVIINDGQENSSVEHTRASVEAMIDQRREHAWTFAFLGANQDAFAEAGSIGVAPSSTVAWAATGQGALDMWDEMSSSTLSMRSKTRDERRSSRDDFFGGGSIDSSG